jgi:hypothetical protein
MSKFPENSPNNQNSQINNSQNNSAVEQEPSLTAILANVLTPLVPVFMAKLTGQKLSVANNAPADQGVLSQLTPVIQNLVNTQNILLQEIILLKKNDQVFASNFQGLKLTHERKQIEYNTNNQNSNDHE